MFVFLVFVVTCCVVAAFVHFTDFNVQSAVNIAAFNTLDVKDRISDAVQAHKEEIAAQLGMTDEQVDALIDQANIDGWTPVTLPDDVTSTYTRDVSYGGDTATVTTYDDPSYVTITYGGATMTFDVPQSAQSLVAQVQ